jgi:hypothetical protein
MKTMINKIRVAGLVLLVAAGQTLWAQGAQSKEAAKQQESQSKDAASSWIEPPQVHDLSSLTLRPKAASRCRRRG